MRPALPACTGSRLLVIVLSMLLAACGQPHEHAVPVQGQVPARDAGYSVLRKMLGDEQHLKTLRVAKSVVTLNNVSDPTRRLIDDIAAASSTGLDRLDGIAALKPRISFDSSCSSMLDRAMLDPMRLSTAKDLLMASGDEFEIRLVVSQVQALRMISELAGELRDLDPNVQRQVWLQELSGQYAALYKRAVASLSLTGK